MKAQKSKCAINTVAIMVDSIHKIWDQKKMIRTLLMDIKRAFDYVSGLKPAQQMRQLGIDNDLIFLIQSFLTNTKVEIVIDGHINLEKDVETDIPQRSPVSAFLFLIYISRIFDTVSVTSPEIVSVSFIDNL